LKSFETSDLNSETLLYPEIKILLYKNKIRIKVISTDKFGLIFSLSIISLFKINKTIYLNNEICSFFTQSEYNAAIAHEIGHFKNKDTLFFPIFNAFSKFMFFVPFKREISTKYRFRMELLADQFALHYLEQAKDLAHAIIKNIEKDIKKPLQKHTILSLDCPDKTMLKLRIDRIVFFNQKNIF
jgi:beta-lactamase regulating signal transducer with metallopeptidase domain